jgi:hypothetical protein
MVLGKNKNKHKQVAITLGGLFLLTGFYNALVINSESHVSEVKYLKRLDEVYGVTVHGRRVAGSAHWQKLTRSQIIAKAAPVMDTTVEDKVSMKTAPIEESNTAIDEQEELSLSLVEVSNAKKWQNGLTAAQFSGSLEAKNGVIEGLSISLPNDYGISVAFTELTGNVFEYDLNGEIFSGMMYQVDQSAYMITLTNGPLEGTRLRFSSQSPTEEQQQTQEYLAENNIEVGTFGDEPAQAQEASPEELSLADQQMQQEATKEPGFNLEQAEAI